MFSLCLPAAYIGSEWYVLRECSAGYAGTEGRIFGGRAELTEVSGTGNTIVSNLSKCQVTVSRPYRKQNDTPDVAVGGIPVPGGHFGGWAGLPGMSGIGIENSYRRAFFQ